MTTMTTAAFGTWPSPITARMTVAGSATVEELRADGADVWWSEQRPDEGGRTALVRRDVAGQLHEVLPPTEPGQPPWNARTALGEYGGGAWAVRDATVVFANWADQRLYVQSPTGPPRPVTPAPQVAREFRYTEPTWLDADWLVCVRETHSPAVLADHGEAMTELVAVPLDGRAATDRDAVVVLWTGPDFVAAPAIAGEAVTFLQWDHPRMPWDGTEVVVAQVERDDAGVPVRLREARVVLGSATESCVQPGFTANGQLLVVTDRSGWWRPWLVSVPGAAPAPGRDGPPGRELITSSVGSSTEPLEAEYGGPMWVGGRRWWAQLDSGAVAVTVTRSGSTDLGLVTADGRLRLLETGFTEVSQVVGAGPDVLVVAATATSSPAPYRVRIDGDDPAQGPCSVLALRPPAPLPVGADWFSAAEHVSFPVQARTAHALYYPPHNPGYTGPAGQAPPLVVMIHGGPTSAARNRLDLGKQFWTSRGFAVVDVDYAGSTGYGREYRNLLRGQWGVLDVADAAAAAAYLGAIGRADPTRLVIRGGSAGGFTTLAALCFHDTFAAGCSMFGVADLAALARDTHKFESRYLDGLVGPYPQAEDVYAARSPINHVDGIDAPLLILQGGQDAVVPPNQAEMIVAAVAARGVPHAYLLFPDEGHGFRAAAALERALEAELWFYGQALGIDIADAIDPVPGAVGFDG